MRKKTLIASLGIIGIFILLPIVQAATPQVWFNDTTEIVWKFTEETLDAGSSVIGTYVSYRKLNFTEVIPGSDHINITADFYNASEADVTTYGFSDSAIWTDEPMSINGDIVDSELTSKFKSVFNELNVDQSDILTLSQENQTLVLMMEIITLDPSIFAALFLYLLVKAFGGYFVHDINSSSISTIFEREIEYSVDLEYANESSGHWNNVTYHSDNKLTYGQTSNILMMSECTSEIEISDWNGSAYVTNAYNRRYIHEIAYPSALVNDYPPDPTPDPKIPGFSIWLLSGAMVLGIIPTYLIIKRKK